MSNIKYLKGVRTRYLNALKKEIETASYLIGKGVVKLNARESLLNVTSCYEKLHILTNKLEIQSEKVACAISESDEEFTECILEEDTEICDSALSFYSRLKQLEQVLGDQIKSEDVEAIDSDTGDQKPSTQLEMQKLFEMQLDLQKEFLKHTSAKPKEVISVKLPKLEISSFNGDKLRWLEFWQSFETSVHNNHNLSKIDKFNYLRSKLTDKAKGAITGLALTSENYDVAIGILEGRFGDTQEIIDSHYNKIINLRPANDSVESLRYFIDVVDKNLRSLEVLGQNVNQEIFVSMIKSKLPTNVVRHIEIQKGVSMKWTVNRLRELLTGFIIASEKAEKIKRDIPFGKTNKTNSSNGFHTKGPVEALAISVKDTPKKRKAIKCRYCLKDHWSDDCTEYKSIKERKDRLKGCCYRCLTKGHRSSECKSSRACVFCSQMNVHHRSLCPKKFSDYIAKESVHTVDEVTPCETSNLVEENALLSSNEMVLMQTAHTSVRNPSGKGAREVRLLLDSGSQRTYITEKLANALGLKGELEQDIRLVTFGSKKAKVIKTKSTKISLGLKGGSEMKMTVNIVPDITGTIQRRPVNILDKNNFKCLSKNLELADTIPTQTETDTVDLLVGNDYYLDLILGHKIEVQPGLYLLSSKLGWLLTGRTNTIGKHVDDVSMLILTHGTNVSNTEVFTRVDESLPIKPNLEDFWKIESIGVYDNPHDSDDEIAMKNFRDTLIFKDNRYHVTWPWTSQNPDIPSNRQLAVGRLKSLMSRLHSKPEIMKRYKDVIDDQLNKSIIEKVDRNQSDGVRHYIPHHAVIKPGSSTTKLRVVYDASAKTKTESKSLNESLYRGPVLLQDLCGILLRFRLHKTVIISDIEKAFLQISLQPSQRDVTRFLWLKDVDRPPSDPDNIQEYRFCRVPFGVISSPFLLGATINHHLDTYDSDVAKRIKRDIYMDNVITGTNSVDEGVVLYNTSKQIFSEASMNLREWASNSEDLIKHIPESDRASGECTKVLGLNWNKTDDVININHIKNVSENAITKRQVLKQLAMVFDPLGLFSPVTLKGKLLLQSLWCKQLKWDDKLDESESHIWQSIRMDLLEMSSIPVPRCVVNSGTSILNHLFCFCDASEKAYATAIYLVQVGNGQSSSELIFSKSRLAPTTKTTIPRLELLAVLIGTRCVSFVKSQLCIPIERCILFSDSQCTLDWIDSNKKLPVFVQNRVQEIRKYSDITFHHVSSSENPADIASRGCDLCEITHNTLWWHGPDWIRKEEKDWPHDKHKDSGGKRCSGSEESDVCSEKSLIHSESKLLTTDGVPNTPPLDIDIERYSSGKRLLRVTATAIRFINKLKGIRYPQFLTNKELDKAEELWIRHTQENTFGDVLKAIRDNKKNTLVTQLGLYLDESQIIRCKGRLNNSCLTEGARRPILIPRDDRFSQLIIQHIHQKYQHIGISQSLSILRQRFWIPRGRAIIRKVIRRCQVCRRLEGAAYKMPPLAPLPSNRVSEAPPFSYTGIDYMGPMYIKEDYQQKKVWVCLYTCMVTRAIHLEMVSGMSTETFLNCFRRFVACRGKPNEIVCDNAMQFKLARETIDLVWGDIARCEDVQNYCANENIKWNFIVELAPWMGGFYERMVGLTKRSLRKAIGRNILDRDQFNTILKESEAVVNSRPLVYIGDDINSNIAITPGHFTCLNPRTGLPDSDETEDDSEFKVKDSSADKLLKIWKRGQKLLNNFWLIWRDEYLISLRERTQTQLKSGRNSSVEGAKVGDVVIVKDSVPRGSWRFGRIVDLTESRDAHVRSAKIRTSSGTILGRPLCSLYPIETSGAKKDQDQTQDRSVDDVNQSTGVRRSTRKTTVRTNARIKECLNS